MKEDFLQYVWMNALYGDGEFITYDGNKIRILDAGCLNKDAGPDFFNARIQMDGIIWVGNVEIHLRSSDWYRHGHHKDPAYDNVILSVVKEDDVRVYNSAGKEVESIALNHIDELYEEYLYIRNTIRHPGCYRQLELIDDAWFYMTLQSLAIERLERKVGDIRQILKQTTNDWDECFYRLLCKYWSSNVNSEPFYQLSLHMPYKILLKYADHLWQVEALLLGVSGILEKAQEDAYTVKLKKEYEYLKQKHRLETMPAALWKFMRIRPDAFPTVRIALLAALLCRLGRQIFSILEATTLKEGWAVFDIKASEYWDAHYFPGKDSCVRIKRMGDDMKKIVFINVVIPFMFIYGKERGEEKYSIRALNWLEEMEGEKNYIVKNWEACGFVLNTASQTQAVIQLHKEYCERHRCLECRIGREILSLKAL